MRVWVGTSGYQYKAWRGSFYAAACKERDMLAAYAAELPSVEINNTFYGMPKAEVLAKWASQVPERFRFVIKAPRLITHRLRLEDAKDAVSQLFENLTQLGAKLACVLFQLPPNFAKDLQRLRKFLSLLPREVRVSFEFRHASWNHAQVLALLREHGAAWCMADMHEPTAPLVATADFGYLRLRREVYSDAELNALYDRLSAQRFGEVFVFFKHEDDAPSLARRLIAVCERTGPGLAKAPARVPAQMQLFERSDRDKASGS
jgi:uncharacterized protein YecE (DUF72 family)